jgi:2-succinyl-6-hydroxy-2,4-cyclohexadiene-1-carboxylate synthase
VLGVRRFGEGPPVVALHGFTHTGAQFSTVAELLAYTILAPDLPGHGTSSRIGTTVDDVVAAVGEVLSPLAPVPLIGYSQGGRIALLTALRHPDLVRVLITISAGAGIPDTEERRRRRREDMALASRMRHQTMEQFLGEWTSSGITATDHLDAEARETDLTRRAENTVEGLAAALEGYGQSAQPSIWDRLGDVTCPTMVVSGSDDPGYTDIGDRLAAHLPNVERVVIEGAGHNPLADQPESSAAAISDFLDRHS